MKKYKFLVALISVFLFLIPFLWLKPGEMDLGGDSSRLYFYDPLSYLFGNVLFGVSPSAFGPENINYYMIPFVLLLALFKSILHSPTTLISSFHGASLMIAFLFCYFIVKELLNNFDGLKKEIIELSSILAGLFYVFSPDAIQGWDKVMPVHNQYFLNPLMFFLLLKYFKTANIKYLGISLFITFIFSPNFSVMASPPIFAFYPLSITFLLLYRLKILKKQIIWKHLIGVLIIFFGIHLFHLLPHIYNVLSPGSSLNTTIFTSEGKFDRGLSYFTAIARDVKVNITFMGLPQLIRQSFFSWVFIILPLITVLGFLWNKSKLLLLTGVFFLIAVFFASANITSLGLNIYKSLFKIPGFSMFRNFYGQWAYLLLFFYTILFGQSLAVVLAKTKQSRAKLIFLGIVFLLIVMASSFINGTLTNKLHYQSKNVRIAMSMDPKFQETLDVIKNLPVDGKFLTLPFTDYGYQTLFGLNGGAYQGPSIIAYLEGRNDFAGHEVFGPFKDSILKMIKDEDYESLKETFALLNIRYIFYNSDIEIYDKNFPRYPHTYVRDFLPDQTSYKNLINNLDVDLKYKFSDKYYIYEVKEKNYMPHIYIPTSKVYFNGESDELTIPLSFDKKDSRVAIYNPDILKVQSLDSFDSVYLKANKTSSLLEFLKKRKDSQFGLPYLSRKPSSVLYPLAAFKEKKELDSYKVVNDKYIDKSLFLVEKRVEEFKKWGEEMQILGNVSTVENLSNKWKEPKLWEISKFKEYNLWEINFVRYERAVIDLFKKVEGSNKSDYSAIVNKLKIKDTLKSDNKEIENTIINDRAKTDEEKKYLLELSDEMFNYISDRLNLTISDTDKITYSVNTSLPEVYEVYVEKDVIKNFNPLTLKLNINGKKLGISQNQTEKNWTRFEDINLVSKGNAFTLDIDLNSNLIESTNWQGIEEKEEGKNSANIIVQNSFFRDTSGLMREISNWKPNFQYFISFEYKTNGKDFKVRVYEKGKKKSDQLFEDDLKSKDWKQYKAILNSGDLAESALFQVVKGDEDLVDKITGLENFPTEFNIKNLSVIQVPHPNIVFKKSNTSKNKKSDIPKITFTKINPTKYKVKIENAYSDYSLVLQDAFNDNWKIQLDKDINTNMNLKNIILKSFRDISEKIIDRFFENSKNNGYIVNNYFNKGIKETNHRNVFLDASTFETWGRTSVAEKEHTITNGYANSWVITKEDVGNKPNYEFILEFNTQKRFYGFFFVSLSVVFLTLLYFLFILIKK